jgi:DNA-binding NarL/FixJ family response regulator
MTSPAKIRIIALGTATTLVRLGAFAAGSDLEILGFARLSDVLDYLEKDGCDAFLVDSQHPEAVAACEYLQEICLVPVALLVRSSEADWQDYCSWKVDGFIAEESSKTEMVARITALARRGHKIPA